MSSTSGCRSPSILQSEKVIFLVACRCTFILSVLYLGVWNSPPLDSQWQATAVAPVRGQYLTKPHIQRVASQHANAVGRSQRPLPYSAVETQRFPGSWFHTDIMPYPTVALGVIVASAFAALLATFHLPRHRKPMAMLSTTGSSKTVSRRDALLGASALGIVANKVAIEGPAPFTPAPGSLDGRTIFITGGNHGLGLESAIRLATGGAKIVIGARSAAKGEEAVEIVKAQSGGSDVSYLLLDLADLRSVQDCAAAFNEQHGALDVLMNNAGVMLIPERQTTKDGFEKQFGINHLGHFALTALLQEALTKGAQRSGGYSRVINVSSSAHYMSSATAFDFDSPGGIMAPETYNPWLTYCQSKLANVMFTKELDRRCKAAKLPVTVVAVHPGVVRTELARYLVSGSDSLMSETQLSPAALALLPVGLYFTKGVDRGANCQIWLAAGADNSGDYSQSGGLFFQNLVSLPVNPAADDDILRARLWTESEKLTGLPFKV